MTDVPTIKMERVEVDNLESVRYGSVYSEYAIMSGDKPDVHALEFYFTDRFRVGYVFDVVESKRSVCNALREMANKIEESIR